MVNAPFLLWSSEAQITNIALQVSLLCLDAWNKDQVFTIYLKFRRSFSCSSCAPIPKGFTIRKTEDRFQKFRVAKTEELSLHVGDISGKCIPYHTIPLEIFTPVKYLLLYIHCIVYSLLILTWYFVMGIYVPWIIVKWISNINLKKKINKSVNK